MLLDAAREEYEFVCFDRVAAPGVPDAIVADLTDLAALEAAARGCDAVVHLAAHANPHRDYAGVIVPGNVIGTYNAFEAAARAGVRRFVFASTVQVEFGHPEDVQVSVEMPAKPTNNYAASKVFGEHLGFLYSRDRGMSVIAIRFGGVVTPGRRDHMVGHDGSVDPITLTERDACEIIRRSVNVERVDYAVLPGFSRNAEKVKDLAPLKRVLGWDDLEDAAEVYRARPAEGEPPPEAVREMLEAADGGDAAKARELLERDPRLANAGGPGLRHDGRGVRPLHYAARNDDCAMAGLLLDRGADPNAKGGWGGRTPLDWAARGRKRAVAEILIARGGRVDVYVASALGDADRLREILARDPEQAKAVSRGGRTPLHAAGTAEVARMLIEAGCEAAEPGRTWRGEPVLAWVLERPEVARFLIERTGKSDVHLDCARSDEAAVSRRLDADPELANAVTLDDSPLGAGRRPLDVAGNNVSLVRLLLERGADPNLAGAYGGTALHQAASEGWTQVIRVLVEGGASLDVTDAEYGATPRDWARYSGNPDAEKLLADLEAARPAGAKAREPGRARPVRKVLVTGAAGATGAAFRSAAAGRFEIVSFDRRAAPGINVVADLSDEAALDRAASGCDAVVHLAGAPAGADFHAGHVPDDVLGTWRALEAARRAGIARFVYASTSAAYGGWPAGKAVTEATPLRPADVHAAVKVLGENLCVACRRRSRLAVTCVRGKSPAEDAELIARALESPPADFSILPGLAGD